MAELTVKVTDRQLGETIAKWLGRQRAEQAASFVRHVGQMAEKGKALANTPENNEACVITMNICEGFLDFTTLDGLRDRKGQH